MESSVIQVEGLGKYYQLGERGYQYRSFREVLADLFRRPFQKPIGGQVDESLWALRNLSFDVQAGEILGVIGKNGAGKSTLLKLLSRVTTPTEGSIRLKGRVGSLLEIGTGFHHELTGKENVFLNGSILGMKKKEIREKYDEIVNFSELHDFMNTPIKRFSTGMYLRLAFSVAAHLDTEILFLDEVLSVGDVQFQKKCFQKMKDICQQGRTIILVSHNLEVVASLCERIMWLEEGKIRKCETAQSVLCEYKSAYT